MPRTPCVRLSLLPLLGLSLLAGACASTGRPLPDVAAEINATLYTAPFEVAPGDVIDVRFPNRVDWNQTVRVRPDGRATFPFAKEMAAAGTTLAQLQEQLRRSYKDVVQADDVVVNLMTMSPRHVIVMGEVHEPGEIVMEGGRMSLIEALGRAGGPLKETALLQNTLLVRWLPQENRQMAWRIDARVDHWGAPTPLLLQPFDVVFVPNTPIDNVDIWIDQYLRRTIPLPFLPIAVN